MFLIKQIFLFKFLLSSAGAFLRVAKMALAVSEKARIAAERQLLRMSEREGI